ncbi:MAG: D-sedoheptulose 7-phosphate isomerase [Pseudomonadota bacterium]
MILMKELIEKKIKESTLVYEKLYEYCSKDIENTAKAIITCYKNKNTVFAFGNGGSAADAQHIAAELVVRFYKDRPPLNAYALTTNTSILTACANDYTYNDIFDRQVKASVKEGDIVIGISTSGNSVNVLKALESAKALSAITIGLTGASGGKMNEYCDHLIKIPSTDTPRIQEGHLLSIHLICELVENTIFSG